MSDAVMAKRSVRYKGGAASWSLAGMFKIMVDGKEHSRYDDKWVWIDVGSAKDAEVRLSWAAEEHLKIT